MRRIAPIVLFALLAGAASAARSAFELPDRTPAGFTAWLAPRGAEDDRFLLRVITRNLAGYAEIVHAEEVRPGRIRVRFPRPEGPYAVLITSHRHAPVAWAFRTRQKFTKIHEAVRPLPLLGVGLRVIVDGRPIDRASVIHSTVPVGIRDLVPPAMLGGRTKTGPDGRARIPTAPHSRLEVVVEHERGRARRVLTIPDQPGDIGPLELRPHPAPAPVRPMVCLPGWAGLTIRFVGAFDPWRTLPGRRSCTVREPAVRVEVCRLDGQDKFLRLPYVIAGNTCRSFERHLAPGRYRVLVRPPLGRPRLSILDLAAGATVHWDADVRGGSGLRLVLEDGRRRSISFRILNDRGEPVEVEYTSPDLRRKPTFSRTATNFDQVPDGGLARVDPGRYRVEVRRGRRTLQTYDVTTYRDTISRLDSAFATCR